MKSFTKIFLGLSIGVLFWVGLFIYFSNQIDTKAPTQPTKADAFASAVKFKVGETLFRNHCAACHKPIASSLTLSNARLKYADDIDWLYAFIRDSQKLIQEGNPQAIALYEQYGRQKMPSFPNLTDEDIEAILAYIDEEFY